MLFSENEMQERDLRVPTYTREGRVILHQKEHFTIVKWYKFSHTLVGNKENLEQQDNGES